MKFSGEDADFLKTYATDLFHIKFISMKHTAKMNVEEYTNYAWLSRFQLMNSLSAIFDFEKLNFILDTFSIEKDQVALS